MRPPPNVLSFLTPPPPPPGADWHHKVHVGKHCPYTNNIWCGSVQALLRYRSKPPKCKNSPLTPIVTKISFAPFFARRGPPTLKKGEDTSRARLRPRAKFGVIRPAGCWEIVDRTRKTNNKCVSKTQILQGFYREGQKVETYNRKFPFESNLESNRRIVVYSFSFIFIWLHRTDVRIRQKYCAIATRLLLCNINPSSNAETIEICRWTVSVVYGTTANVAGAAIRNLRIGPSLSNRIESGRPILIRIESGSFACPDEKATYAACKPLFLAVTEI